MTGPFGALRATWRRSLQARVVMSTLLLSSLVVALVGWTLLRQVTDGLVESKLQTSLQDAAGHDSSALFVQSVPYSPAGGGWDALLAPYVEHLLALCDRFAPGTSDLVADTFALPPPGIEAHFGITAGHIHHVDNTVAFAERVPYATGIPGVYAGSAGCHPAGSVIGAAGHNAAERILADLSLNPVEVRSGC